MKGEDIQIVRSALSHANALVIAMLSVQRDNALYTTIFGDPTGEMYDFVMANVRRLVNILDTATEQQSGSPVTADDHVDGSIGFIRVR
jgi:hypothetical protein